MARRNNQSCLVVLVYVHRSLFYAMCVYHCTKLGTHTIGGRSVNVQSCKFCILITRAFDESCISSQCTRIPDCHLARFGADGAQCPTMLATPTRIASCLYICTGRTDDYALRVYDVIHERISYHAQHDAILGGIYGWDHFAHALSSRADSLHDRWACVGEPSCVYKCKYAKIYG